jgi:hypothetical protein
MHVVVSEIFGICRVRAQWWRFLKNIFLSADRYGPDDRFGPADRFGPSNRFCPPRGFAHR